MRTVDVRAAKERAQELVFGRWSSADWAFNFDGLLVSAQAANRQRQAYTQLFRSGAVELFSAGHEFSTQHGPRAVGGLYVTDDVRNAIRVGLQAARSVGAAGGTLVSASVSGVDGLLFSLGTITDLTASYRADRDQLALNEQWIENTGEVNLDTVARPILDVLWQSFGLESCLCYNDVGQFDPQARFR
ncbi:hypothetical protein [Pelomonas sp. Root1217]|uniref:hypothetical protein n=1 Tax=Pelomonas sp. Root1217 TaxID=1736430 RepID=UPI0012F8DC9D|nr:hypothetical protein [Pelomonas sp. Root1217]